MNGWLFALLYAALFEGMGRSNWWLGAGLGLGHGLFVLAVGMPILPGLHPRMVSEYYGPTPNRRLQPPGFMALNYGRQTPISDPRRTRAVRRDHRRLLPAGASVMESLRLMAHRLLWSMS